MFSINRSPQALSHSEIKSWNQIPMSSACANSQFLVQAKVAQVHYRNEMYNSSFTAPNVICIFYSGHYENVTRFRGQSVPNQLLNIIQGPLCRICCNLISKSLISCTVNLNLLDFFVVEQSMSLSRLLSMEPTQMRHNVDVCGV